MTTELKDFAVCSFRLEEDAKRRFSARMVGEGTTLSERIRSWVLQYLEEEKVGADHPQLSLELNAQSKRLNEGSGSEKGI